MTPLSDAHIHLFANGYPGRYGIWFPHQHELQVYEKIRKVHPIRQALVVGYEGTSWSKGNNRYLAQLAKTRSWMIPLAYCSLHKLPEWRNLLRWWEVGFYGISLYIFQHTEEECLLRASEKWVEFLNVHKAIISVNCLPETAWRLRSLWERLNGTRILFSHLGLPGSIQDASKNLHPLFQLKHLDHLGVKLSGIYACSPFPHKGISALFRKLYDAFGEKRLYWGSDFCPALDKVTFQQTVEAVSGWTSSSGILGKNLMRDARRVRRVK